MVLAGAMLLANSSMAQNTDWNALNGVPAGQRIRLALRGGGSRQGVLQRVDESTITIDNGQIVNRDDVRRAWLKGNSKRGKHALIGAGVGGAIGLGVGAAVDADCSKNSIICTGNRGKGILTPVFALMGAGVGALLPAHGWQEVYRSK